MRGTYWCVSASYASSSCLGSCLFVRDRCQSAGEDCWRGRANAGGQQMKIITCERATFAEGVLGSA